MDEWTLTETLGSPRQQTGAEARLAAIVASAPDAMLVLSLDAMIESWNPAAERLFGYTADEVIGRHVRLLCPPDRLEELARTYATVRAGQPVSYETRRIRKDGTAFHAHVTGAPIVMSDGTIAGVTTIVRDITERKQAEKRQALLVRELSHRVKNLLAVVQAIATMTLAGKRITGRKRDAFIGRLHALARAQDFVTASDESGASLASIVRAELGAFGGRTTIEGPEIAANSNFAQMFALVVHELATNASKYGALSRRAGHVTVRWQLENAGGNPVLRFSWSERGGPRPAEHNGKSFGQRLIERALAGSPRIAFAPEGFSYEIDVPLEALAATPPMPSETKATSAAG
jgi:PAS domain S-box-containing protein